MIRKLYRFVHDVLTRERSEHTKTRDYKRYEITHTNGKETTLYANGYRTAGRGLRKYYRYECEPRRIRSGGKPVLTRETVKVVGDIQTIDETTVGTDEWKGVRWDHGRKDYFITDLTEPRE